MDGILLVASAKLRRCGQRRRFFSGNGSSAATAVHGLRCLAGLVAVEPDVLVVPWKSSGRGDVVARWNAPEASPPALALVIGNAPGDPLRWRLIQ
jgi:hypothetical protein